MSQAALTTAKYRTEYRATGIGRWYSGWAHFAFTSLGSLAVVAFAISRVHHPSWAELSVIPIGFLIANVVEYLGHKGPMHRPAKWLSLIFVRHTVEHHHFFTHEEMSYESSRDFKMVLFPPVMLLFFLGGIATPLALVVFALTTANAGWLFVATAIGYYVTYEWLHFAYHLPESSIVGGSAAIRALRQHHQIHHHLALMGQWNFNITFPICDFLFQTSYLRSGDGARRQ